MSDNDKDSIYAYVSKLTNLSCSLALIEGKGRKEQEKIGNTLFHPREPALFPALRRVTGGWSRALCCFLHMFRHAPCLAPCFPYKCQGANYHNNAWPSTVKCSDLAK